MTGLDVHARLARVKDHLQRNRLFALTDDQLHALAESSDERTVMPNWLKRLTGTPITREGYEYGVAGSPTIPAQTPGGFDRTIEPETLTVWLENGEYAYVEIAGTLASNPNVQISRRFEKQHDLPDWAVLYLIAHEETP